MGNVNLSVPSVQIREVRLKSLTAYQGDAKTLVDYAECGGKGKDGKRSFSQCAGCGTSKAACQTMLIQDAAVISHGPVGCSSCLHEFEFTYKVNSPLRGVANPTQRKLFSTNLRETDTVYGGSKKLAATIREVYARVKPTPNAIFVITTCAAGIIGDDVESVCNAAEQELGIPIVAIFCEGFRSKVWTTGFDAAYHGIARKLIEPAKEKNNKINVINFWGNDIFREWFAEFGVEPNYITPYATVNTLRKSSESLATIQACPTLGSYLGAALEDEFGVPEIRTAPPYGIKQTDRWFRELGRILGKEDVAERVIAEKKEKYLGQIDELRKKLEGKKVYVVSGAAHGHALIAVAEELGMIPVGASVFHHDLTYDINTEDVDLLRADVNDYGNIANFHVCNRQEFEYVNTIKRVQPDVLLARHGGMTLWGAKFGIPSLLVGDEHFSMGYEGIIKYGERILEAIENDEFVKNLSKHAQNPYTDWWLSQDPTSLLKNGIERKENAG